MQYLKQEELNNLSQHELPIESGDGQSPETAYVLKGTNKFEAPSLEYLIIDITLKASGCLFWELVTQSFTIEDKGKIDCLKVQALQSREAKNYSFYFDLTNL